MSCWQAHATFSPAGEMFFGVQAGSLEEAGEAAGSRLAEFGLPVEMVRLEELEDSWSRIGRDR